MNVSISPAAALFAGRFTVPVTSAKAGIAMLPPADGKASVTEIGCGDGYTGGQAPATFVGVGVGAGELVGTGVGEFVGTGVGVTTGVGVLVGTGVGVLVGTGVLV